MSNPLAITTVSALLQWLLANRFGQPDVSLGGQVKVTTLPPDQVKLEGNSLLQLNLFLYQLSPNPAWRNVGLPARDERGERVANPPLALDLHYLLTAYANSNLHAEALLGYAMQVLHEMGILTRKYIQNSIQAIASDPTVPLEIRSKLGEVGLESQIEQIKLSPEALSTEEHSRLWSAMQAKYRPTVAYQVSVVLIEAQRSRRVALPVRPEGVGVYARPLRFPRLEAVRARPSANADLLPPSEPILLGYHLVLQGQNLSGEVTQVRVGGQSLTPAQVSDTEISFPLPTGLRAGPQTVMVQQQHLLGEAPAAFTRPGEESNPLAFLLSPGVSVVKVGGKLELTFTPRVGREQQVTLLLNEFDPTPPTDRPLRAYSFPAPAHNGIGDPNQPDTDKISFTLSGVEPGDYLVRAQVDGAHSPLTRDLNPASPTFGLYVQPQVSLP